MSAMRVDAKVVMLGKESVGKTSLVERYVHHRFLVGPYQNTIGAAFVAKPIQVADRVITLGIWDTAGSERYEAMSRIYYRGARAAVVCYDLTDSSSFQRAKFWVKELQNCEEHCKIYVCGTKSDLVEGERALRQTDFHDAQDFAEGDGQRRTETNVPNVPTLGSGGSVSTAGYGKTRREKYKYEGLRDAFPVRLTSIHPSLHPSIFPSFVINMSALSILKPPVKQEKTLMNCSRKLLRISAALLSSSWLRKPESTWVRRKTRISTPVAMETDTVKNGWRIRLLAANHRAEPGLHLCFYGSAGSQSQSRTRPPSLFSL